LPAWPILEPHRARVAEAIQVSQELGDGLLAGARLVSSGHVGDLHVLDQVKILMHQGPRVAADHARVILVELKAHVGRADRAHQVHGPLDAADVDARKIGRVQVFNEQRDAPRCRARRRPLEVRHQRVVRGVRADLRRWNACQHVEPLDIQALGRLHSLVERAFELRASHRVARQPALASLPVAGRGIEHNERQSQVTQQLLDASDIQRVDEEDLDPLEPGIRGSLEAVVDV